jgi:small conductance mechanosensitive channel
MSIQETTPEPAPELAPELAPDATAQDAANEAVAGAAEDLVNNIPDATDLEGWTRLLGTAKDKAIDFLPILGATAAILFIGWIVARVLTNVLRRIMQKSKVDKTLTSFVCSCVYFGLMAFVVVAAITKLGVNTASFVAIIGAAGFAVGFALQGSLSNFAAGVMLMIFRPLKAGDLVEAGGVMGHVEEVGVFATIINTLEHKRAIIANATVTGDNIINYSANGKIRVDMTFGIGYSDDIDNAKKIMSDVLAGDPRVLKTPGPTVAMIEHGANSVNFACRPFVKPEDYWDVWFDTHEAVKKAFDKAGVSIPFPQRDVHLHQVS